MNPLHLKCVVDERDELRVYPPDYQGDVAFNVDVVRFGPVNEVCINKKAQIALRDWLLALHPLAKKGRKT
jgi:hypothetical protein